MMVRSEIVPGLPVHELPPSAHAYADFPYQQSTAQTQASHIRAYESWCCHSRITPWPPTLATLLNFAAAHAQTHAYHTVKEAVRIVAMRERKRGGPDYYSDTRLRVVLDGIRRERRPAPVRPVTSTEFEQIVRFIPRSWVEGRMRMMGILAYAAGFSLDELIALEAQTISFVPFGALIADARLRRREIWFGRGEDAEVCPVAALEGWVSGLGRETGPVFPRQSRKGRALARPMGYRGLANAFRTFGVDIGWAGALSVERLRRGGMIEQARSVDVVPLAKFHGFKTLRSFEDFLGVHVERQRRPDRSRPDVGRVRFRHSLT